MANKHNYCTALVSGTAAAVVHSSALSMDAYLPTAARRMHGRLDIHRKGRIRIGRLSSEFTCQAPSFERGSVRGHCSAVARAEMSAASRSLYVVVQYGPGCTRQYISIKHKARQKARGRSEIYHSIA